MELIICIPNKAREYCNQNRWWKRNKEKFKLSKWRSSISLQLRELRVCLQWWRIWMKWIISTRFHINMGLLANHVSSDKIKYSAKPTQSLGMVSHRKVCRTSVALTWCNWPPALKIQRSEILIKVQLAEQRCLRNSNSKILEYWVINLVSNQ